MTVSRTNKNVCLFCFGDLDKKRVCLNCGRRAEDEPTPAHRLPPRLLLNGKYLIVRTLGEGGFGITYLAWDAVCGEKVAIKEYFPTGFVTRAPRSADVLYRKENRTAASRGLKRFTAEARILAEVQGLSGIVSVLDYFCENETAYIVMEYLDGISLKKYVAKKGGRLPVSDVLGIMRPIMDSLIPVHEKGLIHRDISPDNIIITKNGKVKLIDFGAAKQTNIEGKSLSIVLKQGFAPEEQYRTHGEQGPWTDVYALAATIYYCITGQMPPESIQRLVKDTIMRPSELGVKIATSRENALMKALSVYKKNRYETVKQFAAALYRKPRADSAGNQ